MLWYLPPLLLLHPRRAHGPWFRSLSTFPVRIVAAVYCNGWGQPRVEGGALRGQGKGEKEGQAAARETFIFTRSLRVRLRWYNSCLRDYLFSLKRLPVGGFSSQAARAQGRKARKVARRTVARWASRATLMHPNDAAYPSLTGGLFKIMLGERGHARRCKSCWMLNDFLQIFGSSFRVSWASIEGIGGSCSKGWNAHQM